MPPIATPMAKTYASRTAITIPFDFVTMWLSRNLTLRQGAIFSYEKNSRYDAPALPAEGGAARG
ncbi:MAG: hypothetical protein AAGH38_12180, partial [Pseudomonadota bacterium]